MRLVLIVLLTFIVHVCAASPNDCYEGKTETYRGTVSETRGGITCQRWDSQHPHEHRDYFNKPEEFIDGLVPENYCRNIIGENHEPWCYTTDPAKRWDYCDVPECQTPNNCYVGKPENYNGTVSVTRDGIKCQRWDSQYPHEHSNSYNKPEHFIDGELPENYCRNIIGEDLEPWCYTTNPAKRWDYCRVSGECQSWTSWSPWSDCKPNYKQVSRVRQCKGRCIGKPREQKELKQDKKCNDTWWKITVYPTEGARKNGKLWLEIYGENGTQTGPLELDVYGDREFHENNFDTINIGKPQKIKVWTEKSDETWHLAKIWTWAFNKHRDYTWNIDKWLGCHKCTELFSDAPKVRRWIRKTTERTPMTSADTPSPTSRSTLSTKRTPMGFTNASLTPCWRSWGAWSACRPNDPRVTRRRTCKGGDCVGESMETIEDEKCRDTWWKITVYHTESTRKYGKLWLEIYGDNGLQTGPLELDINGDGFIYIHDFDTINIGEPQKIKVWTDNPDETWHLRKIVTWAFNKHRDYTWNIDKWLGCHKCTELFSDKPKIRRWIWEEDEE